MLRWFIRVLLVAVILLGFPTESPAPLVYRPGEGFTYEAPGSEGKWTRARAKDQLEVAQGAYEKKNYGLAIKAARRTVKVWPTSDYAPEAQHLLARCYEAKGNAEKAFKEYQRLLEKHPKFANRQEVLQRQFEIANRYLAGKWFRFQGLVPLFPSMSRTVAMYEKIIKNGPYSAVAPQAQMNIGAAREKQENIFNRIDPFREAVAAYEKAADRYRDDKQVASDATYKAGMAYLRQALKADYDQSVAGQAINTFDDFSTLYPDDPRVPEARETIASLKREQARGAFAIARYYEKHKKWTAAAIYYSECRLRDPSGPLAEEALRRLDAVKNRTATAATSK